VTGQQDQGKDRQEQGGRTLPRGGVRHSLRRGHQPRGRRAGPGRSQQYRREVRRLYSYAGERIGQGRENTRSFLKENKEIFAKMDAEVRKTLI